MTTSEKHFITARQFRNIRKRIAGAMRLPLAAFARCPDGWSKFPVDPLPVDGSLKHLHLRRGTVLRAYQFRQGGNGNAFAYALSEDAPFPEPEECLKDARIVNTVRFGAPSLADALPHFMAAFEGDGSPQSYMEASVLFRELGELGAVWHGGGWSTHTVFDADPFAVRGKTKRRTCKEIETPAEDWQWANEKPAEWRLHVKVSDSVAIVTFYSYSGLGQEAIYVNADSYPRQGYVPECLHEELAHGPGGYVF